MSRLMNPNEWKMALAQLCKDAGYERPELLQIVEAYEQLAVDYAALLAEHERLKQEAAAVRKPRSEAANGHMSSKLWDAIHE